MSRRDGARVLHQGATGDISPSAQRGQIDMYTGTPLLNKTEDRQQQLCGEGVRPQSDGCHFSIELPSSSRCGLGTLLRHRVARAASDAQHHALGQSYRRGAESIFNTF